MGFQTLSLNGQRLEVGMYMVCLQAKTSWLERESAYRNGGK